MNLARMRLLDAIATLSGDVFTDIAPSTLTAINGAWRRFQELLVNYGVTWFKPETILTGVPAVTSTDPGSQVYFNWVNYFDGGALQAAPVLPQNFIAPADPLGARDGRGLLLPDGSAGQRSAGGSQNRAQ